METLSEHAVSAVPVVTADRRVVGIVSEADLLHKMEFAGLEPHLHLLERNGAAWPGRRRAPTWRPT